VDPVTGHSVLVWRGSYFDLETREIQMLFWTDEVGDDGELLRRKYRRLGYSWIEPEQTRAILEEAGFAIEAAYGNFDRSPLSANSQFQIWVACRPA